MDPFKTSIKMQATTGSCVEGADNGQAYDTILRPTILGYKLQNNPYSVENMQLASLSLYGTADGITVNKWYVRFKPASPEQLSTLDSLDIDLFDYPLDYEVIQEGDYYDDGVTPAEEIPWLYAVVNTGFTPPSGITYQLLEQLHVPTLASIEAEAFRLTGNPVEDTACGSSLSGGPDMESFNNPPFELECAPGYVWNTDLNRCIPDGSEPPPAPTPTRMPSGTVRVFDNNRNEHVPVRNVHVIAKRFLKVARTYTNNQGQYFISKEFRKVNIYTRTENNQASIRSLRRARLWQMLTPVEQHFGVFSGSLNNREHNIDYFQNALSIGARNWAAASVHNNVQEFYQYAGEFSIGTPPQRLKVLLTNWRLQGTSGAAPMYAKRYVQELPETIITTFLISTLPLGATVAPLVPILKGQVDVTLGYNMFNRFGFDRTSISDAMGETAFHELTHAAHYNKVGNSWWKDFVDAEINQMIFSNNSPYGTGNAGTISNIIALGESWAYHMGHFMSDRKYGLISSPTITQFILYENHMPVTNLSSHINLLEDFNPQRTNDPDRWIPQGLYYDLIDDRNDATIAFPRVNLMDNVSGYYNNQHFFNALDPDIRSMDAFRLRLLSENNNNQSLGVNVIFDFYENW